MTSLLLALLVPSGLALAETPEWMVPGTELVYDVAAQGTEYEFHVVLEEADEGRSFSWSMTEPVSTQGWVDMSPEALKIGRAQVNAFTGGRLELAEATTVWLSQAVYAELKEKQRARVVLDGEEVELVVGETHPFPVTIMGPESAPVPLYAASEDGGHAYWILDDPDNPLILKMDHGWTISLRYIAPGQTRAQQEAQARAQFLDTLTKVPDEPAGKLCLKAFKKARKAKPWTYAMATGAQEPVYDMTVSADKGEGKDQLVLTYDHTWADGRQVQGSERYRCVGEIAWLEQSYLTEDGKPIHLDPPLPWLPMDLEGPRGWNYRGVWTIEGEEALVELDLTVGNPMTVTVPAGTYQALPFKWVTRWNGEESTTRDWILPGRMDGLLRREDDMTVMELQE